MSYKSLILLDLLLLTQAEIPVDYDCRVNFGAQNMGMVAQIFRGDRDCSNGGISSWADRVCITNVAGPFSPSAEYPAVLLVKGPLNSVHLVPAELPSDSVTMAGGCFVHTSDSRFSQAVEKLLGHRMYGAVALHDRVE